VNLRSSKIIVILFSGATAYAWPALAQDVDGYNNSLILQSHGGNGAYASTGETPRHYNAIQQYQVGMAALKAGRLREAQEAFDNAVTADPNNVYALTMRGVVRSRQGDLGGAAHDLDKSLKMDPTQIIALGEYGVVLAKQGKTEKAKSQLGLLTLQAEGCGDTCPDAAKLKDAAAAVRAALAQPAGHS
jgi:predicted Zn-dependent protease